MALQATATFNLAGMASRGSQGIDVVGQICNMDPSSMSGLRTPEPEAFAKYPSSWYYVCTSKSLFAGRAMGVTLCGRRLVIFRGDRGMASALEAWCPHIGSDMSLGRVVGDTIECPNHHFRFDATGSCATEDLRAKAYPVEEQFGAVFVFLGPAALFPLPAFPVGLNLVSAAPMQWDVGASWYMLVANPFDSRHFASAHGRRLMSPPSLRFPHEFALQIDIAYEIAGASWTDRATRWLSGPHVRLEVTAWGGNIALVRADFAKDRSFGIMLIEPRYDLPGNERHGARVTVIVSAQRRGTSMFAKVLDAARVRAKRFAIGRFLAGDANGVRRLNFAPGGLRAGDEVLAQFLRWVVGLRQSSDREEVS